MYNNSLTFALFAVILSSLTLPAFADSYTDKFPNCSVLDGFVTNADDSTGIAKECLDNTFVSFSNFETPVDFEFTLSEITAYCSQFSTNDLLEESCIDDYITVEEHIHWGKAAQISILLVIVATLCIISGAVVMMMFFDYNQKIFLLGMIPILFGILILAFFTQITNQVHPPLV